MASRSGLARRQAENKSAKPRRSGRAQDTPTPMRLYSSASSAGAGGDSSSKHQSGLGLTQRTIMPSFFSKKRKQEENVTTFEGIVRRDSAQTISIQAIEPFVHGSPLPALSSSSSIMSATTSSGPTTPDQHAQAHFAAPQSHPYASHSAAPSNSMVREQGEEDDCPVCSEPLSMRLAGEKPHVVPACGHRLHEACFEAVYGPVAQVKARARLQMRQQSIGLCGVCRRDMKLGEGSEGGSRKDKFAAISGLQPEPEVNDFKVKSISKRTHPASDIPIALHDPSEDDELFTLQPLGRASNDTLKHPRPTVAQPRITVHSETPSIARPAERHGRTRMTTLVTVEMPSRFPKDAFRRRESSAQQQQQRRDSEHQNREESRGSLEGSETGTFSMHGSDNGVQTNNKPRTSMDGSSVAESTSTSGFSHAPTRPLPIIEEDDPALQRALKDLKLRLHDWKGHEPDNLGKLRLCDTLQVVKDDTSRAFQVYLFDDALLCVSDDRKKGIGGRLVDGISISGSDKLRLKGRVYVRHMRSVELKEDLSLLISMGDDRLEAFVLTFDDLAVLQKWKQQIDALVAQSKLPPPLPAVPPPPPPSTTSRERFAHPSNRTSMISTEPSSRSSRSDRSSNWTHSTSMSQHASHHSYGSGSTLGATPSPSSFPALDLVLLLSVPPQTNAPSAAPLKSRLLRNTVEFLVSSGCIGPSARVSIIAYCAGDGARGVLRKTPLLSIERSAGRLATAVKELAADVPMGEERELRLINHNDDRVTVVTAANLALDILLQRRQKAPLTGIILVNDGKDGAPKQQMDLVMARLTHASVPLHAFGWGKAHDPSSLWLLSNHTGGTYTFVREWYGLRDAVAGCVGGMLSIAATSFKLHISVPEKRWFSIRKVAGVQSSIVSSDGKDADIDLGELRSGERREMLVEVEMSSLVSHADSSNKRRTANITATDEYFMNSVGLKPMSLEDETVYDDEYDSLIDDVPLFEVNASFRDPVAAKYVSRLPTPILLTVTIGPPQQPEATGLPSPDAGVVRRRIELLCSDVMTRCLLMMSRRQPRQALNMLGETRRIVQTILATSSTRHMRPEHIEAASVFNACLEDIDFLLEGVRAAAESEGDSHVFETNHRNFAAQQAVVLRDQRAWTDRSLTERAYFGADLARYLAQQSRDYLAA